MIEFMLHTALVLMLLLFVLGVSCAVLFILDAVLFNGRLGPKIQRWCQRKVGID